jgi:glycosyltransferase involved in cell wall biosynthesis
MPKILFFITKSNWGGAQKYVYDISTDKVLREKYLPIVALGGEGVLSEELSKADIRIIKAKFLKNSLNPILLLLSIFENIKIIRSIRPDIVHTNSSFAGLAIGCACFLTRQKSIFTVHGWPQNESRNSLVKIILGQAMAFVILFHNKTICVSKKVFKETPRFFGIVDLKNKCVVIHHGMKVSFDFASFEHIKKLDHDVVNIATIAELNDNKNHPLILKALAKLPEDLKWNYHMLGDGANREEIHKQIIAHKYSDKIFSYGFVKDAKRYLFDFDLFVLGSITESFGFVLLEAGAAKLPCIATRVGGIPEIIDDGENGIIVESNNVHQMTVALEKLITNKDLRKELGENLFKKVLSTFSKEKMVSDTIAQYEKVMSL